MVIEVMYRISERTDFVEIEVDELSVSAAIVCVQGLGVSEGL